MSRNWNRHAARCPTSSFNDQFNKTGGAAVPGKLAVRFTIKSFD